MFRSFSRFLCFSLALGMAFLLFGCSDSDTDTGAGYLFTYTLSENPACLDPQFTDNDNAALVISNIMEGLLRQDENGTLLPAGAESYTVSEDGLYYMFNLRTDCVWYSTGMDSEDAQTVTAEDYVYAFRRLIDPVTDSPHSQEFVCLKNAAAIMAGTADLSELGVSAPDANTLIFQLEYPNAEFLQLLTQSCAVPCNEAFFLSTNGRYGLDVDTVLCNGPFYLTKWVYDSYGSGNFMSFRKNQTYYGEEDVFPSSLTFTIMRSQSEADADFADGNSDVILTDTYPQKYLSSKSYTVESSRAQTLGLIFNPENTTLQNDKLRQALAYGINRTEVASLLSEDLTVAYGIIPPAVNLLGRSYRELYADEQLALSYNPTEATALFEEVSEELGLNSMNTLKILVPSDITDTDALLSICQEWQNLFGYYIGIETVTQSEFDRRIAAGEYSIALYSISAGRNSCYAVLQEVAKNAALLGMESEDFGALMQGLSTSQQLSDSVTLYGAAEQAIMESRCFIPLFYKNTYLIYTSGNEALFYDAFARVVGFRDAKHFS